MDFKLGHYLSERLGSNAELKIYGNRRQSVRQKKRPGGVAGAREQGLQVSLTAYMPEPRDSI